VPGYDLHTHTTFSDGTTSPERNVELAVERGLEGLGVTDHDTAATWDRAAAAAEGTGLEIVPGAELSAELDGYSVHVLGYWFDRTDPALAAEMDRIANERARRAEEIVLRFNGLGIGVTMQRVRELAGDAPIGRPHLAAAVVETGAAGEASEVFDRWLHDGGPAYVPKYAVTPERCVELVVDAGGVAVLAHPGLYGAPRAAGRDDPPFAGKDMSRAQERPRPGVGLDAAAIEPMVAAGLAGIEADHPDHDDQQRRRYRDLAAAHGLVVTAGSDFHGDRKDLDLGQATTPRGRFEELRARIASARPR
jgi:predicted metal-dependent phosphoesterase TrpH